MARAFLNALKMTVRDNIAKKNKPSIQVFYSKGTLRSSALLSYQTFSNSSGRADCFSSYMTVKDMVALYLFAKTIIFGYEPAMPFTPAQDHQVELSISIVHKISCIPEIQSVCFLLY